MEGIHNYASTARVFFFKKKKRMWKTLLQTFVALIFIFFLRDTLANRCNICHIGFPRVNVCQPSRAPAAKTQTPARAVGLVHPHMHANNSTRVRWPAVRSMTPDLVETESDLRWLGTEVAAPPDEWGRLDLHPLITWRPNPNAGSWRLRLAARRSEAEAEVAR